MSVVRVDGIEPELKMLANQQRWIYGSVSPVPLYQDSIDNLFVPTPLAAAETLFELRNSNSFSGYRLRHVTEDGDTIGSLKFQSFTGGSTSGTDLLVFNDDGSIIFTSDAKYILQTANANLPNAQSLGALTTGLLKNTVTTGTGVLSTATPGTDYYSPGNPTTLIDDFTDNVDPLAAYGNLGVGTKALNSLVLESPTNTLNIAVGPQALSSFTAGAGNTSVGSLSLLKLETGTGNSVFGLSMISLENGDHNSVFGYSNGNILTTANRNCFFGSQIASPILGITSLEDCCFIGFQAGTNVNGIIEAIAIGTGSRVENKSIGIGVLSETEADAVCIGWHSNANPESVVVGNESQTENQRSVVIGHTASTNGGYGVAVGWSANSFGANATALGESSEAFGVGSVSIGSESAALGDDSIAIGQLSRTNDSSGTGCIAIGKNAQADGTNSIAIGKDVIVTANNSMALGNGVNVGIGTFAPAYRLDVVGTGGISINANAGRIIGVATPTAGTDAANKAYVDASGVAIANAQFIIRVADPDLPNAQILGSLATGIVKNTTTTGVLSIAVAGMDYYSLNNPTKIIDNVASANISIGVNALNAITSGTGNALFGRNAGNNLTSGNNNCIFYSGTGMPLTTGGGNSIFGASAGTALTTGGGHTLIGISAGQNLTVDSGNTFIGGSAGNKVQGGVVGVGQNVGLGADAGAWGGAGFATYDHCTFLGWSATLSVANLTNATAIGASAVVSTSNSMVLGDSAVNVGMGTSSPTQARCVVSGGVTNVASEFSVIRATGNNNATKIEIERSGGSGKLYELRSDDAGAFSIFDRTAVASRMFVNTSGNIGVNMTSSILAKLHVTGGVQNQANEDSIIRATSSANVAKIELQCTNGSGKHYEFRSANDGALSIVDRTAVAVRFFMNTSGQIGLGGLTTPHAALQFPNVVTNRQLVLYEAANNNFQFHGFGSVAGGLGYNINDVGDSHIFYAGVNTTTRNEVARFSGTGDCVIADTYYGKRPSGTCYMQANATATAVTAGTWTKIAGTTSSASLNKFTMPTNNRLQYTGTPTVTAIIVASITAYHDVVAGSLLGFSLFKNGVQVVPSAMFNQTALSIVGNTCVITIVSLATNDYIEVYGNSSANANITASNLTYDITTT